eukprot:SAG31_NODE_476_length_15154_cov_24.796878_17_plen_68_part_00
MHCKRFEPLNTTRSPRRFCINFTNETLQATFNKHVFMGEIKIYEAEGLQAGVLSHSSTEIGSLARSA